MPTHLILSLINSVSRPFTTSVISMCSFTRLPVTSGRTCGIQRYSVSLFYFFVRYSDIRFSLGNEDSYVHRRHSRRSSNNIGDFTN